MDTTFVGPSLALVTFLVAVGPQVQFTDSVLKQKYGNMDKHWKNMLASCSEHPGDRQARSWLRHQKDALGGGKLCRERAQALCEAGYVISIGDPSALISLVEERAHYSFAPSVPERLAYAAVAATLPTALLIQGCTTICVALGCALGLLLAHITACDLRARIIPYQACIAYGLAALTWVALLDPGEIALNALLAAAAALVLAIAERAALFFTHASAIGAGDRRLIPLICFQIGLTGLLPGLIGLCCVAGAMAIFALIRGRAMRSYLPFAPALLAMAYVGTFATAPILPGPFL